MEVDVVADVQNRMTSPSSSSRASPADAHPMQTVSDEREGLLNAGYVGTR
jgi:hypothetical protein